MKRWALLLAAFIAAAQGAELTPLEREGRVIYLEGTSPSGARIGARIGQGGMDISGQVGACGNCHGEDGRGRPEGGIEPSVIVWSDLVKPYGHQHANGRRHGPYDERSLKRSLTDGVDPDGHVLDAAMPRYSMSERDFRSLVAYLKVLEQVRDPGLTDEAIRVGTLLPLTGRLAEAGLAVRDLLQGGFAAINARGGIHGRRLELVTHALPETGAATDLREWLATQPVFALLAPLSAGVEADLAEAVSRDHLPVIGPLTLFPEDRRESNPQIFHLLPGVPELALLLAQQAARDPGRVGRPAVLLHADQAASLAVAQAVQAQMRDAGWTQVATGALRPGAGGHDQLAAELKGRGVATALLLGAGGEWPALARAGQRIGWLPRWLLPGPLASRETVELPPAIAEQVTLAYPSAPGDRRADAVRELEKLSGQPRHQAVQVAAYAASQLLVEALKRSGRELSRRKLLATLEAVQGFETGLMPPLSYNADRRIGAWGGYLVGVDAANRTLRPLGGYERLP